MIKHQDKVLCRNIRHLNPSLEPLSELSEELDYDSDNVDNDDIRQTEQRRTGTVTSNLAKEGDQIGTGDQKPAQLKDYVMY